MSAVTLQSAVLLKLILFISSVSFKASFKSALLSVCFWGQEGLAALKPCESHANNVILCLLSTALLLLRN